MTEGTQREAALRNEVLAVLTNHVPVGLEGVAEAQHEAVMGVLGRYAHPQNREVVADRNRSGLRALHDLALQHERSRNLGSQPGTGCWMCRDVVEPDRPVAWPCLVWQAAVHLGIVDEPRKFQTATAINNGR